MQGRVEEFRQVGIDHVSVVSANMPVRFLDCIDGPSLPSIAIGAILKVSLEYRFQTHARQRSAQLYP